MGTLYYTGQELLEDKKRGKFRGRLSYRDTNNKRRYITCTLKATGKRAANAELAAWRQDLKAFPMVEDERSSFTSSAIHLSASIGCKSFIRVSLKAAVIYLSESR